MKSVGIKIRPPETRPKISVDSDSVMPIVRVSLAQTGQTCNTVFWELIDFIDLVRNEKNCI